MHFRSPNFSKILRWQRQQEHREGTGRYERGTADDEAFGLESHRYA
jgi:hypothetical protein